jgi:hypothetical protein
MKNYNNLLNLVKYIGKFFKSKKSYEKHNRREKHQPRWMYRNE